MAIHPLAGTQAPRELLANVPRLVAAYYLEKPDPNEGAERVQFGTSGHRGSALRSSFNEDHVLAISQAVCDYRRRQGIDGPLFLGADTHALSEPAVSTALEVLVANGVTVKFQKGRTYTPTPVISHAILSHNREGAALADGIVVTPSHNPPEDGGFKYNPPHGGPAESSVTSWIQERANALLAAGLGGVERVPFRRALGTDFAVEHDFVSAYVRDLQHVVDLDAVRAAGLKLGVDPMGGASLEYWDPIAETYGLDLEVVHRTVDPTFGFMAVDHDGKIRMDCSSPFAMRRLIDLKDRYDIAFGNDPDADRHGIVTRSGGLMNPNHYLAVAVWYLFQNRPGWPAGAAVGKTLVSSALIDRVAADLGRRLVEVPVGFKWFVEGLRGGDLGFGGEESAGASLLRLDGTAWTTDKDGIVLALLAAEITAKTGRDPSELYAALTERLGAPTYARIDAPATPAEKQILGALSEADIVADTLAGEPIIEKLTHAPGNGASIGGVKVAAHNGWFAARPSGTEDVYKIYAESFVGAEHLVRIQQEAKAIVDGVLRGKGR